MTDHNSWLAYGRRLRVARIASERSEAELAIACGVSLRTYQRWEQGCPQRKWLKNVSIFRKMLNVTFDWLFEGDPAGLSAELSKNKGGKVAIIPVLTADVREIRRREKEMWGGAS